MSHATPETRREWTGFYYDGRSAHKEPVTVTVGADGLHVRRADGGGASWPYEGMRQTQGWREGEQFRLEFGSEPVEALVVNEAGLAAAIQAVAPHTRSTLRGRATSTRTMGWIVGSVVAVIALYIWGMPALADSIAPRVPIAWEARLGSTTVDRLVPMGKRCDAPAELRALRSVLDRLVTTDPASPYTFTMLVANDSAINAFAAPGGFVVVNSGLLTAARTPEELAGVLAHEIQHVLRRHSTRAIIREVPLQIAIASVAGGNDAADVAARAVGTLGVLRYRRSDEEEADREGMKMLQAARLDPAGMVAFMRTLDKQRERAPRLVSYLSSHPNTAERVAQLDRLARQARYQPVPLDLPVPWTSIQTMCGRDRAS